jgi:tRNA pseudouridine55 synthase
VIDGLVVVDKPAGMTSHDVVARCRRIFSQRRVGHAGTLDPDATGVLVVGLGRATRLLRFLGELDKCYEGEVVCGVTTSTLDAAGEVTGRFDMAGVTLDDARRAAQQLTGDIEQIPPMVSAVKVGGRRLHQLARQGIEVERRARPVRVDSFELAEAADPDPGVLGGGPVWTLRVRCSSGTYVRTLAADLGAALGGGAHLRRLRRTAVGAWTVEGAVPLDELAEVAGDAVLAPAAALPGFAVLVVAGELAAAVGYGRPLPRGEVDAAGEGPWAVLDTAGSLLAVYGPGDADRLVPLVVLAAAG